MRDETSAAAAGRRPCRGRRPWKPLAAALATIAAVGILALPGRALARPYGVVAWSQYHDFDSEYRGRDTDVKDNGGFKKYEELGFYESDIRHGTNHCVPTSAAMIDDYWDMMGLAEVATINKFARGLDTNDWDAAQNSGDNDCHVGTFWKDVSPNLISLTGCNSVWYTTQAGHAGSTQVTQARLEELYRGEIRAGRPCLPDTAAHCMCGIGYNATSYLVNDPAVGANQPKNFATLVQMWTMAPNKLPDVGAGAKVFFSNDNFGTGQANAQAPGGDPGDVYCSGLTGSYARVLDDVPAGLSTADAQHPDYNNPGGSVTSGVERPFDMDAMDVLQTIQPMRVLCYSQDHGDPNPHLWVPGVSEGSQSYAAGEIGCRVAPTEWFTAGLFHGSLEPVGADEVKLGLNRGEDTLPGGPLDDDVDALELEFDEVWLTHSSDFVDTRVFPEYTPNAGPNWHQMSKDPTDIYGPAGAFWNPIIGDVFAAGFLDGESILALSIDTDVDAIQFFSVNGEPYRIDGLLYSVDGDAHECMDRLGGPLDPGEIYLSWLDGNLPIPFLNIGGDVDAIVWVPEPTALALLAAGACLLRRRRRA